MELNRSLAHLRKKNKLSQIELAEKLGVSRQAVSMWETGRTQITVEHLARLSELYGVAADDILRGDFPEGTEGAERPEPDPVREQPPVDETDGGGGSPRRRAVPAILFAVFCGLVALWGEVTHSQVMTKVFFVFLAFIIILYWLLHGIHTIFTHFRKDDKDE